MKRTFKKICTFVAALLILSLTVTVSIGAADAEEIKDEPTFFDEVYESFSEHSAEIFSALSLVGSCLIAFMYKNGLLPGLKAGIGAIKSEVEEIRKESCSTKEDGEEIKRALAEIEKKIAELDGMIGFAEKNSDDLQTVSALIDEQVSLLFEIFMSSSMPEYKKEAVGRRVEKMRAALAEKSVTSDEKTVER